jgi:aspartyl protease family protein
VFAALAVLIAVGLALLIGADAGGLVDLTGQQIAGLITGGIVLIFVGAGLFTRRQRFSTIITNLAGWIAIVTVLTIGYTYREELRGVANRVFGELVPSAAVVDSTNGAASFARRPDGHFEVGANINGTDLVLMFDTGASAVVLSYDDARRIGVDLANLRFNLQVSTANGTGHAARVMLDRIEVGGIARSRVRAFVAEQGALEGSLLGMTFLETLSHYGVTNNRLELRD